MMATRTIHAGAAFIHTVNLPRYRASFTAYLGPNEDGSSTCIPIECEHLHTKYEDAVACAPRLAKRVERHPEQFPAIVAEMARS